MALRFGFDSEAMTTTTNTTKKLLGAAAFSLVLAGGGVAGALLGSPVSSGAQEATQEDAAPDDEVGFRHHRGEQLEVAAEALGMSVEDLRAALAGGQTIAEIAADRDVDLDTVIDALVAQATEDIRERVTAMVNGEPPLHHGPRPFHVALATAAESIGITEGELRSSLRSGESIASVAEANGVAVDTVIADLVAEAEARIDEKVADGTLTEERAAELKAGLEERITTLVNHEGGVRGPGHHGRRGPGGPGH